MRISCAARRPAIVVTALLAGLACQDLWGHGQVPPAQVPEELRGLQQLGELRLKTYSIHGLAPLVVLFTLALSQDVVSVSDDSGACCRGGS